MSNSPIKMTSDYDIFKFREDNRVAVIQSHVQKLADSIKSRNLLELRPISVNSEMEVMDGQHRLLAAKLLGVPIYYRQDNELQPSDIILMNLSQTWKQSDYLNYYCKNNYPEYLKMKEFMKKNNISIKIALGITCGHNKDVFSNFKNGNFKFNEEEFNSDIDICWDTIEYIKQMRGFSPYTHTSRFWKSLLILIRHVNFNAVKWRDNLKKMIERFTSKASQDDYLMLFLEVHNWNNKKKVEIH